MQIKLMGTRENAAEQDFSGIPLEEEEESHLKDASVISMGTEISVEDMMNIEALCDQVLLAQSPERANVHMMGVDPGLYTAYYHFCRKHMHM